MIYLYGVVDDPEVALAGLTGHGDAPLTSVPAAGMAAIGSVHRDFHLPEDPAALWAHNRVVDGLMARCTVAPARFGSTVRDPDLLAEVVQHQEKELRAALARIRGRVELALRASLDAGRLEPATSGAPSMAPGRRYLDQLRRLDAHPALRSIHASLSGRAAHSVARFDRTSSLHAAYLVDRDQVDSFAAAVSALAGAHVGVACTLTGPWAPFSFVEAQVPAHG